MYSRNSEDTDYRNTMSIIGKISVNHNVIALIGCVVIISSIFSACTNNVATPPDTTPTQQSANQSTSQVPVVTNPTTPQPLTPAPATQPITPTPATTTTPTTPPPVSSTTSTDTLIRTEACKMTLTLADMGTGWMKGNAVPPSRGEVTSSCSVHYYQGSSFAPVVQNTVAVYRRLEAAQRAYTNEESNQSTVTHPSIGNECFLNDSVAINKLLVFRKANVVVWVWLQQDKKGDIEHFATILEPRIGQ